MITKKIFGLCNLAVIPLRAKPDDRSEMVSQILFGEHFRVTEQHLQWYKIKLTSDNYVGWIDAKQFIFINSQHYYKLAKTEDTFNGELLKGIIIIDKKKLPIPFGASITFLKYPSINLAKYSFKGKRIKTIKSKSNLIETAFMYLNTPYLWGGKTLFGIDCSGFTQMVYKINGYKIPRDAYQQATQGDALSFIEESEPGDLAFFENEYGKIIHVAIIMENNYIIHAHGKVRIDRIDHLGIYNIDTRRHTHQLRMIRKII